MPSNKTCSIEQGPFVFHSALLTFIDTMFVHGPFPKNILSSSNYSFLFLFVSRFSLSPSLHFSSFHPSPFSRSHLQPTPFSPELLYLTELFFVVVSSPFPSSKTTHGRSAFFLLLFPFFQHIHQRCSIPTNSPLSTTSRQISTHQQDHHPHQHQPLRNKRDSPADFDRPSTPSLDEAKIL